MDICVVGVMHSKFYQFTNLPWLLFTAQSSSNFFLNWSTVNLQCCVYLFFFFNFWLLPVACGILSSLRTRDQALIPCIGRRSLSHWTTRASVIAQPSCFTSARVHDLLISEVCVISLLPDHVLMCSLRLPGVCSSLSKPNTWLSFSESSC